MSPRAGRPSGASDARDRILTSARTLFADNGFQSTSMRSIAADAGVDAALITHYFGSKRGLFLAAIELPVDPEELVAALAEVPIDRLGSELLRNILTIWSSPAGPGLIAVFRSSLAGDQEILRDFITTLILPAVRGRLERSGIGDLDRRLPLAGTQIAGLMVMRHLLRIEPLASMSIDTLVIALGPNIDRLLVTDLP